MDAYYVNNHAQEAGKFFREYQRHTVLGTTFADDVPANFQSSTNTPEDGRKIKLFGASQPVGQAKLMAQVLEEQLQQGMNPEETLIVLPDEKLLLPVLHGLSGRVEKLNITMGFPLHITPLFNLVELVIETHINKREDHFNHRQVVAVLSHPYLMAADTSAANAKRKEILKFNWVHIPESFLATECELHRLIFRADLAGKSVVDYLQDIVMAIGALPSITEFDQEYAYQFYTFFNRIRQVIETKTGEAHTKQSFKSFLRLFRQLVRSHKIPFTGEPLRGLQIMGVLETRNLDFKNVFVLSLNEGAFPTFGGKGSYIPFNIRKAYGLPTVEHQDAIYAYLFYRVLQRADNVHLFYNSETDVLGQGEMSRYLQQLIYESGIHVERQVLHNPVQPHMVKPITVEKDQRVYDQLARHCAGHAQLKALSPSALNDYIDCRLKFYFRHLARIKEAERWKKTSTRACSATSCTWSWSVTTKGSSRPKATATLSPQI
ncbi:MAG: hypothetical protein HC859_02320 [Bacteroidia bacterium]|nr:hypothetical protein [Bacteroidia bacterium]